VAEEAKVVERETSLATTTGGRTTLKGEVPSAMMTSPGTRGSQTVVLTAR
jgi:hypothetical protein